MRNSNNFLFKNCYLIYWVDNYSIKLGHWKKQKEAVLRWIGETGDFALYALNYNQFNYVLLQNSIIMILTQSCKNSAQYSDLVHQEAL